jgi:hypothetical protein
MCMTLASETSIVNKTTTPCCVVVIYYYLLHPLTCMVIPHIIIALDLRPTLSLDWNVSQNTYPEHNCDHGFNDDITRFWEKEVAHTSLRVLVIIHAKDSIRKQTEAWPYDEVTSFPNQQSPLQEFKMTKVVGGFTLWSVHYLKFCFVKTQPFSNNGLARYILKVS